MAKTDSKSPSSLRDRAFASLIGNQLDPAIANLEEAVQKAPAEASLLSDLSALYSERARAKDRPEDYVAALEMAERAVAVNPELAEAVFNRGIALERLFLHDNAREAWTRYLEIDPNSPWAAEARWRLKMKTIEDRQPGVELSIMSIWVDEAVRREKLTAREDRRPSVELPIMVMGSMGAGATESSVLNDEAESLESLGKSTEAWRYRYRALAWSSQRLSRAQAPVALRSLMEATLASLVQRRPMAALELQKRALKLAETLGGPDQTVEALLGKARIEAALGRQPEAKRDFSTALEVMHDVRQAREALAARFDLVQREIAESEDRAAAIALERQPLGQLDARIDFEFRRGDTAAAESNLRRALDELERKRTQVAPGSDRVSFFDQAQPLYMRMVALQLHLGKPAMALEALESFRARALLDQIQGGKADSPMGWRDLSRRVPAQTTILVYAVVEGRLVTWIVQPSGISVSMHQPEWATVSALVQRLSRELRESQTADRCQILAQLYRELVEPVSREMRAGDRIIFVPTRSLYSVPFAALRAPGSGRFLVQDHAVGVAPSVSEFVTAVKRDRRISAGPIASALLVGYPSFNRQAAPQLPSSMPGAEREIETLSAIYHSLNIRVLTRSAATPSRVLDSLGRYQIAHLAVHGQQDREDPTRAHLLLAQVGREPGDLSVKDILRTRLPRTRLVMLAACETHAGSVSESEGSLSLAHAFLAAGAPAVIGSLWRVTDWSTERLSVRFHQELLRGADALSALRTAQLAELATNPDGSDWTWASFQVFGGVAERTP